jgi:putative DNA-invertase from lambdoid prophage Rac
MQLADIRRLTEARGWQMVVTVEEKASGARLRPARERLIEDAKTGSCDAVVVWKLDRWGRSTLDVLSTVMELDAADIAFVSVQDHIDMSTAQGRLMVQLLAAQFPADLLTPYQAHIW